MTAFEKMKLREVSLGSTPREEMINNARYMVDMLLPDDPSFKYGVEIIRNGEVIGAINLRMDNRKLYQGVPQMDLHDVLSNDIKFRLGDVLHTKTTDGDSEIDEYWLCIDSKPLHDIQRDGKVEECNYKLPFQNKKTLEIIERWCSVRDPYASGLDEGKVVTTGNAKYKIKLPYDDETAQFHLDKRFLIDIANNEPIPYKIVKFDSVSNRYAARNEGFLVINLNQTELSENDNHELMIADYIEPGIPSPPSIGSCLIEGSSVIRQNTAREYIARFFDADGNEIQPDNAEWEMLSPEMLAIDQIAILSQSENRIELRCADNAAIGDVFTLLVRADDAEHGEFMAEINVEIRGVF